MKIALVSGNPHLPQVRGGVEINTHELSQELMAAGHEVIVVAKLSPRDRFGMSCLARMIAARRAVHCDSASGYRVYRSLKPWKHVRELPAVDGALIQNGKMIEFGSAFRARGVPTVAYFHGLPFDGWQHRERVTGASLPFNGYVAVSRYVAERFKQTYGLEAKVVPPVFRREHYAVDPRGREVLFVNPVPEKGVELALRIAKLCPEISFGFVLGWPLATVQRLQLELAVRQLANVRLHERTHDMRAVYRRARVLLVPSQWEAETWGRVATEAQFSGIPVVASNRGGLPEAVGPGGIILAHDAPAAIWADAVRRLWHSVDAHRELAGAALQYAARSALDPRMQVCALVDALRSPQVLAA